MIRRAFIRLLDWVGKKLDESAWEIMERTRKRGIVPAPKTPPGPKTARLPDGYFAYVDESGPFGQDEYLALKRLTITPDRPAPTRYWEGLSVEEICAELEGR